MVHTGFVGFIPALKREAFSSNYRNPDEGVIELFT